MKREVTPEIVCNAVAETFGITKEVLCARPPRRCRRNIAEAKQVAAYMLRMYTDLPLRHISATLSIDDKQYITYCVKKTVGTMGADLNLKVQVCKIELRIFEELNLAA